MNIESIRKLLCSESEDDNLLALNILRGRHVSNWGGFLLELGGICHGYFYTVKKKTMIYINVGEYQAHLWDKYFNYASKCEIKQVWYEKID